MKKLFFILFILFCIRDSNLMSQCGYNPNDSLIIPFLPNLEANAYSMAYSLSNWSKSTLCNAKEINSDKDKLSWLNSENGFICGNKQELIEITYNDKPDKQILEVNVLGSTVLTFKADYHDNINIHIYGDSKITSPLSSSIKIDIFDKTKKTQPKSASYTLSGKNGFNNSRLLWTGAAHKNNCIRVCPMPLNISLIIENINLCFGNPGNSSEDPSLMNPGAFSFLICGCSDLTIRNCYFLGFSSKPHILIDGCSKVFIDKVRIEGKKFIKSPTETDYYSAGGILISNFGGQGIEKGVFHWLNYDFDGRNYHPLEWLVVQNCYFKNLNIANAWQNIDALASDRPANGIVFNCFFENWNGDAIDWAYRNWTKPDGALIELNSGFNDGPLNNCATNNVTRIERCIFYGCAQAKFEGEGPDIQINEPSIFCTNNLYLNTGIQDYHSGIKVYHVNETFYLNSDNIISPSGYLKNQVMKQYKMASNPVNKGFLYYINTLFYQDFKSNKIKPASIYTESSECAQGDIAQYFTKNNNYINLSGSTNFFKNSPCNSSYTFSQWQELGQDKGSQFYTQSDVSNPSLYNIDNSFLYPGFNSYCTDNTLISHINSADNEYLNSSKPGMSVTHDFYKTKRTPTSNSVGAINCFSK